MKRIHSSAPLCLDHGGATLATTTYVTSATEVDSLTKKKKRILADSL